MNNITKGDLLRFVNSYGPIYLLENSPLKEALIYIGEVCVTYFLHGKSKEYVLDNWEYKNVLYNKSPLYSENMDLTSIFENYHKWYLREQIINKIVNES